MSLIRRALLSGSTSPWLRERAMKTAFVRRAVSRFMPGEAIEDALRAAAALQARGITTILTRLGENLDTAAAFDEVTAHYLDVLDRAAAAGLDAQISIKPTQLGLDLDPALCERNLIRLVDRAVALGNFVWIDMESSPYVERTIALYRRMRERTPLVGIALQAYLYRTAADVEALVPLGAALRIVKGAYLEPASIAYPRKADVDASFFRLCTRLLAADARGDGALLHIATHDTALAGRLAAWIADHRGSPRPATSSRCSTASSAASRSGSPPPAPGCASSSATASTGSPGTCAASPSAPPTYGSSSGRCSGRVRRTGRGERAMQMSRPLGTILAAAGFAVAAGAVIVQTSPAQPAASAVLVDADDIGGVVTGPKGPEAGVWVIAETTELPTKFVRIVVTDDRGRYLVPDLPKANYSVWVRGYGLVDSPKVTTAPGKVLNLTAVVAPDAHAAAQYYPAGYWFSLLQVPDEERVPRHRSDRQRHLAESEEPGGMDPRTSSRAAACPAISSARKATREIPPALGKFDSSVDAWERRVQSGQAGSQMMSALNQLGAQRALTMFADWTDRIAAGEVPPAPPRPQGIERNVVITEWDWADPKAYLHDEVSTDRRNPTLNAERPDLRRARAERRLPAGARPGQQHGPARCR